MATAVEVVDLWKRYRYGVRTYRTLRQDAASWWARLRGRQDPNGPLEETTDRGRPEHAEGYFWALRDVAFSVQEGEVVGIIGRNGAGKSTLLKAMSRITAPTRGEIRLRGRVSSLLEVGTGFHEELTGRENIFLNGAILGMSRAEIRRKLDAIIAFSEVERFIDTPVKRYSSGMAVRLAFAVAAHLEPEILVVDEVLAVGDAAFQEKCLGKMQDMSRTAGRTVLFVSHQMPAVENLCSRGIVLEGGTIRYEGTAREAVTHYLGSVLSGGKGISGEFDVSERINPYNAGRPIIQKVSVLDERDSPTEAIRMGEDLRIAVDLEGHERCPGAQIGVAIRAGNDEFVAHFTTAMSPERGPRNRASRERALAVIRGARLNAGTYTVDAAVAVDGVRIFDYVARAARFKIVESDVYGNGYRVKPEQGVVFVEGDWRIVPLATER